MEYCSELNNNESYGDNVVLYCSQPPKEVIQPVLHGSNITDKGDVCRSRYIPVYLVQAGGDTMHVNASILIKVLGEISFHVMAEIWKHLKDILAFSSFLVC